jgi:hypothetical protein
MDKHYVREIANGKSAQFPKTWKVNAAYHVAGQEMLGQDTDETENVISIDGLLVSHIGIYDLDEAMSHFEVRGRYTEELGKALARVLDTNVYRTIVKTARADTSLPSASMTSPFGNGQVITSSDTSGTIAATAAGAQWWEAMRAMELDAAADNGEDENLWLAVPFPTFDSIANAYVDDDAANGFIFKDRRFSMNDEGLMNTGPQVRNGNVTVFPSNLLPSANDAANADVKAKYRADYSGTLGVGWANDGVGTVKLIGMGLETDRDTRRQEDFIVAKVAVGHGPVRNEFTWEITA